MSPIRTGRTLSLALAMLSLAACTSTTTPSASLTIRGKIAASGAGASRVPGAVIRTSGNQQSGPGILTGDPGSLLIGMYALYISANADCSNYTLVQDYGTTAAVKDFIQNPTLFSGSPAAGSYACVGVKMSDVIGFKSKTTFGSCDSTVTYNQDIYRSDNAQDSTSYWRDINLNRITPHGTDSAPVDDHVLILFTRDTSAAIARGFSTNQTIQLGSSLVVPGSQTFVWGGAGTVLSDSTSASCGVNPGRPSFQ